MISQMPTSRSPVDTLDVVKVTEAAALAASRWMGRGQRTIADALNCLGGSTGTVRFIESVHRLRAKPHRRRP
jgi:phosphoribosylcarboxyaminoimidazole (NCAIR) mutase